MIAIAILITLTVVAIVGTIASIRMVVRDDYRRIPARTYLPR